MSDFKAFALHLRKWRGWGYHSNLAVIPGIKSPVVKVQHCHLLVRKHGLIMSPSSPWSSCLSWEMVVSSFLTAEGVSENPNGNPIPARLMLTGFPKGSPDLRDSNTHGEKSPYCKERDFHFEAKPTGRASHLKRKQTAPAPQKSHGYPCPVLFCSLCIQSPKQRDARACPRGDATCVAVPLVCVHVCPWSWLSWLSHTWGGAREALSV